MTVCGELASEPIGALALLAIGYRSVSVVPSAVGPVKAMLLDLDCGKVAALIDPLLDGPAGVSVRDQLKAFVAAHKLQI